MKKFLLHTLGCRLNQAESALLIDRLARDGWEPLAPGATETPELIIVNSCAVTATAVTKSRQAARRFRREFPGARIVVTGCAAELADKREADGALLLGNAEKTDIVALLAAAPPVKRKITTLPPTIFHENAQGRFPCRTRTMVKIQEGCDNFCTYCIVPYTRGRERSRAFDEVLAECRAAIAAGVPELVLTGVNTCAYRDGKHKLTDLLETLCALPGSWRLRLSSTEPHPDNLALLAVMARHPERIARFLHLSLQHGCDRILRLMNRHYDCAGYAAFATAARAAIPDIHLGTDLIVGFPGETDDDFAASLDFVQQMAFANMHLFTYSPRVGTPAATFPDPVAKTVAKARFQQLEAVAATMAAAFAATQEGKLLPVIFEPPSHRRSVLTGWSDNYLACRAPVGSVPVGVITPYRYVR